MKYQVNEVLGLASCHAERKENRRYVQLAKLDIPPDCIALLDTVCNLVPCPPAVKQMQKHPYDCKGDTHTLIDTLLGNAYGTECHMPHAHLGMNAEEFHGKVISAGHLVLATNGTTWEVLK